MTSRRGCISVAVRTLLFVLSLVSFQGCSNVTFRLISEPSIFENNDAKEPGAMVDVKVVDASRPDIRIGGTMWRLSTSAGQYLKYKKFLDDERDIVAKIKQDLEKEGSAVDAGNLSVSMRVGDVGGEASISEIDGSIYYGGVFLRPESVEVSWWDSEKKVQINAVMDVAPGKGLFPIGYCLGWAFGECKRYMILKFNYSVMANPHAVYTIHLGRMRESDEAESREVVFRFSPAILRLESWH